MKRFKRILGCAMAMMMLSSAAMAAEPLAVNSAAGAFVADENGEELISRGTYGSIVRLDESGDVLYAVTPPEGGLMALCSGDGTLLTGYEYDFIFEDGAIFCLQGDKYGVLAENGTLLAPCEYTFLTANGEGGFLALRSNPYDEAADGVYLIDADGTENATGVKALHMYTMMREGLLPAVSPENNLYGYLGSDGQWAIQPQYDYADVFYNGCAQASISTGTGLISRDGKWLISPKYQAVDTPEENGKYRMVFTDTGVTLFDNDTWQEGEKFEGANGQSMQAGYLAVFCQEETILFGPDGGERFRLAAEGLLWDVQDGMAIVQKGEWGENAFYLYDMAGQCVSEGYQMIGGLCDGLYLIARFEVEKTEYDGGELVLNEEVPDTMRMGCMDMAGHVVVEMEYTNVQALSEDRLWLETEETGYLADVEGNVIAEYALVSPGEEAP